MQKKVSYQGQIYDIEKTYHDGYLRIKKDLEVNYVPESSTKPLKNDKNNQGSINADAVVMQNNRPSPDKKNKQGLIKRTPPTGKGKSQEIQGCNKMGKIVTK